MKSLLQAEPRSSIPVRKCLDVLCGRFRQAGTSSVHCAMSARPRRATALCDERYASRYTVASALGLKEPRVRLTTVPGWEKVTRILRFRRLSFCEEFSRFCEKYDGQDHLNSAKGTMGDSLTLPNAITTSKDLRNASNRKISENAKCALLFSHHGIDSNLPTPLFSRANCDYSVVRTVYIHAHYQYTHLFLTL